MVEFFRFCRNIASSYFTVCIPLLSYSSYVSPSPFLNYLQASQMANICLVLLLLYSGFLISKTQMHLWVSSSPIFLFLIFIIFYYFYMLLYLLIYLISFRGFIGQTPRPTRSKQSSPMNCRVSSSPTRALGRSHLH